MTGFVVLHYNNISDTIQCVDSLLNTLSREVIHIVVVDNASPNKTGLTLKSFYNGNNKVSVIINDKNEGFSKGNNIGCSFLIINYSPDFICVLNNDTYIDDVNFINKINVSFNKYSFDALGPRIWNLKRRYNQNPVKVVYYEDEIDMNIINIDKSLKFLNSSFPYLFYIYHNFIPKNVTLKMDGLYGAAVIFSSKYFNQFDKVFPELTFMYGEENFLNLRRVQYNLSFIYDYSLTVYHNHSSSTRLNSRTIIEKWKFQMENIRHALIVLRDIKKENKYI